jgi:hypothetical protein
MWLPEADSAVTVEHVMAYEWIPDSDLDAHELATLERGYRRDLLDVAAARASCASLRQVADRDEQDILRALARIEILLQQRASRQVDEDRARAVA